MALNINCIFSYKLHFYESFSYKLYDIHDTSQISSKEKVMDPSVSDLVSTTLICFLTFCYRQSKFSDHGHC